MKKLTDDDPVTMGALRELLTEMFAAFELRMGHMMDAKIAASEERVEIVMDAKVSQLERNLTELINDCMERIDERFNRLERDVAILKKGMSAIRIVRIAQKL
jgi:hypothetical protein